MDASGSAASFLGRDFGLPSIEYGPKKAAVWTHFKISDGPEGTTLYVDSEARQYMEWIWEIPINPDTASVGLVITAEAMKRQRAAKLSVHDIYQRQLMKFDRFKELAHSAKADALHMTSFTCRTFQRVIGPNWIIIGEAASMVDPVTGNGVTAALRHAAEGSALIRRFRCKGRISGWAQAAYNMRVRQMGRFFNNLIEKLAYRWPIRDRIGLLKAGDAYTIPAWSINQLYTRIQPSGMFSTGAFSLFLASTRGTAWLVYQICTLFPATRTKACLTQRSNQRSEVS